MNEDIDATRLRNRQTAVSTLSRTLTAPPENGRPIFGINLQLSVNGADLRQTTADSATITCLLSAANMKTSIHHCGVRIGRAGSSETAASSGGNPEMRLVGDGPTRNMASSQVMCVNFLLPLVDIPGALNAAIRAIDDDVECIVEIHHEGRMSSVEFEWNGLPRSLEGRTDVGRTTPALTPSSLPKRIQGGAPTLWSGSTQRSIRLALTKVLVTLARDGDAHILLSILPRHPRSAVRSNGRTALRSFLPDHAQSAPCRQDGITGRTRRLGCESDRGGPRWEHRFQETHHLSSTGRTVSLVDNSFRCGTRHTKKPRQNIRNDLPL